MRKRTAKKRILLPDPRFNDQLVTRFVNNLMWDGKKSVAFKNLINKGLIYINFNRVNISSSKLRKF